MARFLVGTTPLVGHVGPVEPVVAELVRRGHEVRWYTGGRYRRRVESLGAAFEAMSYAPDLSELEINQRFPDRASLTGLASLLFDVRHLFGDPAVGQVQDMQNILKGYPADAVLADSPFVAARWLHELGGPPWAVVNPFAISFSSRDVPPFGLAMSPASSAAGRFRVRLLHAFANRVLYRRSTAHIDRLRRRLGLPPGAENFWDHTVSPYLFMQGSIPGLEYPRSDLPPQFHAVGPLIAHAPAEFDPPDWWSDLDSERPVVHVTQGTISNDPDQLLRPAIEALAGEDVLVVVTTGGDSDLTGRNALPSNVRVTKFLPYNHLLPKVDLMVTNGGYNGVQIALSYGIPLVVAGDTEDKPETCARVEWAGAGINLRTSTPGRSRIHRAVREVLNKGTYRHRARDLARAFQAYDAPATAANLLETLAETGQPVYATRGMTNK